MHAHNRKRWWLPSPQNAFRTTVILGVIWLWLNFAAWVVHVVTCLRAEEYALLIAGAIAFPIGILHGWLVMAGIM